MPEPSLLPVVNAAALALTIVSITLSWYSWRWPGSCSS